MTSLRSHYGVFLRGLHVADLSLSVDTTVFDALEIVDRQWPGAIAVHIRDSCDLPTAPEVRSAFREDTKRHVLAHFRGRLPKGITGESNWDRIVPAWGR